MKKYAIVLLFFFTFALCLATYKTFLAVTHPMLYVDYISTYSKKYDVEPSLIASMINVESSFNSNARSNKNAIGLMQIKLTTANYILKLNNLNEIDENELFEPIINIKVGCMYVRYLLNKFKDENTMLASYNAGETRVRSWLASEQYSLDGKTLNNIPYLETKNYVKKINKNINYYKKYI